MGDISPTRLTLSWQGQPGSEITGYTVTSDPPLSGLDNIPGLSVTINKLSKNTAYTFTVAAKNVSGTGPASSPLKIGPPSRPRELKAPIQNRKPTQVKLTWTEPANANGSKITGYTVTSKPPVTGLPRTVRGKVAIIKNLNPKTNYRFRVAANNASGTGSPVTLKVSTKRDLDVQEVAQPAPPQEVVQSGAAYFLRFFKKYDS